MRAGLVSSSPAMIGGGNVYEREIAKFLLECAPTDWSFVAISKSSGIYRISEIKPGAEGPSSFRHTSVRPRFLPKRAHADLHRLTDRLALDVLIFLSPVYAMSTRFSIPTIGTVWDFGVFDLTHFPEFAGDYAKRMRETIYAATQSNFKIMVPTKKFGAELTSRFGTSAAKVVPTGLPLPTEKIESSEILPIKFRYFTYPAKYWRHKNHSTIFRAFASKSIRQQELRLVLTGIAEDDKARVANEAKTLGMSDQLVTLGHLPYPQVQQIIANSAAVLMPSLLGPVNYPPLEALAQGTRVIQSDVHDFDYTLPDTVTSLPATAPRAWEEAMLDHLEISPTTPFTIDDQEYRLAVKGMFSSVASA